MLREPGLWDLTPVRGEGASESWRFTDKPIPTALRSWQPAHGKDRALDNLFIERLSLNVKYQSVFPHDDQTVRQLHQGLEAYFRFYSREFEKWALPQYGLDRVGLPVLKLGGTVLCLSSHRLAITVSRPRLAGFSFTPFCTRNSMLPPALEILQMALRAKDRSSFEDEVLDDLNDVDAALPSPPLRKAGARKQPPFSVIGPRPGACPLCGRI